MLARFSESSCSSARGPVLLTGAPYSGTTWMGHQLRDACGLSYFQEPWNPQSGLVGYDRRFRAHHAYLTDHNAIEHLPELRRLAAMRPRIRWRNLLLDRAMLAREIREHRQRRADRQAGRRPLWKDPIALLSSGWIARTFDSPVLLMVRNPLSFVTSNLGRGGASSRSGLSWLLDDQEFMRVYGEEFRSDLHRIDLASTSPVERWALAWRLLMSVALRELSPVQPQVVIARYEDCLERPVELLARVADLLGLPVVVDPAAVVSLHRDLHAHGAASGRFDPVRESTRWDELLSSREQSLVRSIVEPLSSIWYGERASRAIDAALAWSSRVA